MVVWQQVPWKVGTAPWRQDKVPPSTSRPWKKSAGAGQKHKGKGQQYHVCPSCPKWCYHDKLQQQGGLCLCGATIDHKLHHRSKAGWDIQVEQHGKVAQAMAILVGNLDSSQQAAFQIEYPDLLSAMGKPPKEQDSFQLAVKDSTQAFKAYTKAVGLKSKLQLKVAQIEQQLEDVRKELIEAVTSFEAAEMVQLAAVATLGLEAKKEPEPSTKVEELGMGMELDGGKKDEGATAGAEAAAEEPEQLKQFRATLDESGKSKLDAHLEHLGATKRRKLETTEAKTSMEQARIMAQGLQAMRAGFDFSALAGKGTGGGGPTRAEGKGSARHGPY
jgi:hypothetical protein